MNIYLIGIGTGNIEHITLAAIEALKKADLIILPRKKNDAIDLLNLRKEICKKILKPKSKNIKEFIIPERKKKIEYIESVEIWHNKISQAWNDSIVNYQGKKNNVALLIWGDPMLYDSSIKIARKIVDESKIHIISGISSLQALAAAHKITINDIGGQILITTGRLLRKKGRLFNEKKAIIMLDGECSFQYINKSNYFIWWGAYLGMKNEITFKGELESLSKKIIIARKNERNKNGWIMDTYLLERKN